MSQELHIAIIQSMPLAVIIIVLIFAKDIIKNQKTEIDFMQSWLKKAGTSQ